MVNRLLVRFFVMNDNLLTTISRDDLFQWEMLNDFVNERAINIMDHYVGKTNSDCVEEVDEHLVLCDVNTGVGFEEYLDVCKLLRL